MQTFGSELHIDGTRVALVTEVSLPNVTMVQRDRTSLISQAPESENERADYSDVTFTARFNRQAETYLNAMLNGNEYDYLIRMGDGSTKPSFGFVGRLVGWEVSDMVADEYFYYTMTVKVLSKFSFNWS